jgi:Uma2 family endonuclease
MAAPTDIDVTTYLPATFTAPGLTEQEFLAWCNKFPDAMVEYTPEETILIMPPTDPESGGRVAEIQFELESWNRPLRKGRVVGPDTGFFFPKGSRRAPDVTWFNLARWQAARQPGRRFPTFAPEFVIEVLSPTDRLRPLREKMVEYIDNGVELGWLIDPFERTVEIYRPNREPELLTNPASVIGDGPVTGFTLPLERVFAV